MPASAPRPRAGDREAAPAPGPGVAATVGHGRLAGDALARLVADAGVAEVIDVRRTPFSRRNPQFNRDRFAQTLFDAGVAYRWWESLGGRREVAAASPNDAVVPADLRGYADHLATDDARAAVGELARRARTTAVAIMCAEGDPRRCHRRLLADALETVEGVAVVHLAHDATWVRHHCDPSVRVTHGVARWDRGVDRPLDP